MQCVKQSIFHNNSTKNVIAKIQIEIFNFEKMRTVLLPFNLQGQLEIRVPSWSTLHIKIQ